MKYNFMDFIKQSDTPEKGTSCVYTLYADEVSIYVGQTSNLSSRIYKHLLDGKAFTSFDYIACDADELNNLESLTIVGKQPTLNKNLPKNDHYIGKASVRNEIAALVESALSRMPVRFSTKSGGRGSTLYIDKILSNEIVKSIEFAIDTHLGEK